MVFWEETMNHCACVTSYKIYRHVWLIELFHFFARNLPILPAAGSIPLLCLPQVFPPVWLWDSSPPTRRSLRWSPPLASLGLWDTTPCGAWPPLCTPPSCLSQTPSPVRPWLFTDPSTVPATWLINLVLFLFFFIRTDCCRRSGPDGWGSHTLEPPSEPCSHCCFCFLH